VNAQRISYIIRYCNDQNRSDNTDPGMRKVLQAYNKAQIGYYGGGNAKAELGLV
jgi:hypothetical protein